MYTVISAVPTTLKLLWKGVWCYTKTLLIWSTWGPKICLQTPWLWIIPSQRTLTCYVIGWGLLLYRKLWFFVALLSCCGIRCNL